MFEALVKSIQAGVTPQQIEISGETYSSRELHHPPAPPTPKPLTVSSLSSLIDYLRANPDDLADDHNLFIHVQSCEIVHLRTNFAGRSAQRLRPIEANCEPYLTSFSFGTYQPIEAVIIALQSQFEPTNDRAAILEVLGTLKDERVSTHADDGVTQSVTTRKGLAFGVENTPVPRIVTLQPYRTFTEIKQPISRFILRLKQAQREGEAPTAALFEADGGRWKLQAIDSIKDWLRDALSADDSTDEIPVI